MRFDACGLDRDRPARRRDGCLAVKFLDVLRRLTGSPASTGSDAIGEVAAGLPGLAPEQARFIAGFALLLSRIAAADHEVGDDEAATLERLVREKTGLPADQAALVVTGARTHQRQHGGTEDFLVSRELAQRLPYDEKLVILECLFAVAAADERIRTTESNELGRIANELRIEHRDFSRLRTEYREYLAARTGLG
jgi:uncharacterized tellurite resistance protein B-like protein